MAIVRTRCPRVTSPCTQLPAFAPGQKSAFCELCQTRVHNLSALNARERTALLAGGQSLCVRYSHLVPAVALLAASQVALAQDTDDESAQMESVVVVGGGSVGVLDSVFLESEEEDDAWMDEESGSQGP